MMPYMRFNRYIVECKGWKVRGNMAKGKDLIDTLWNVKHIVRLDVFGNDKI